MHSTQSRGGLSGEHDRAPCGVLAVVTCFYFTCPVAEAARVIQHPDCKLGRTDAWVRGTHLIQILQSVKSPLGSCWFWYFRQGITQTWLAMDDSRKSAQNVTSQPSGRSLWAATVPRGEGPFAAAATAILHSRLYLAQSLNTTRAREYAMTSWWRSCSLRWITVHSAAHSTAFLRLQHIYDSIA